MSTKQSQFKKLLTIDDDELLQQYISVYFEEQGFQCDQLFNGGDIEGYFTHSSENPDLILLDVMMPGENGFYWLKWLNENYPKIPVIMLTAEDESADRVEGLKNGAIDYVCKPFHSEELLLRVQNVLRLFCKEQSTSQQFSFGSFLFNLDTLELRNGHTKIHLTENEKLLLNILCENYSETITREALSQAIGVHDYHPLDRRVDVHISRLRHKMEQTGEQRLIHVVRNKGYFLKHYE